MAETRTMADWGPFLRDPEVQRLLAVAKALLIAADVGGSALATAALDEAWIADSLATRADSTRLGAIAETRLQGHPPRLFQEAVGASDAPLTLVRAGCGTGKTAAAYLWACQHGGRQIWFCYPTTGTATEGYRDYLIEPDVRARLEHGRRAVDLELLGITGDGDVDVGSASRDADRLESLRVWGAEVVACTVDTVLGLIQNHRKGLYAWPGLAQAALVFDEIHAYDHHLFGALLRFLQAFPGLPALMMTASLPQGRLERLRALCQDVHHRALVEIDGPAETERLPRYLRVEGPDPWALVREVSADHGKVLWVSNTVGRCMDLGEKAMGLGERPLLYHSRFRYCDRAERHGEVVAAFQRPGAAFALTTQVAEMSLDLSADLLVTDLAPVPALIQRLGRLNRGGEPGAPDRHGRFIVLQPVHSAPYTAEDLGTARAWLDALGTGSCSQTDLIAAWHHGREGEPSTGSAWLDGGAIALVSAIRPTR